MLKRARFGGLGHSRVQIPVLSLTHYTMSAVGGKQSEHVFHYLKNKPISMSTLHAYPPWDSAESPLCELPEKRWAFGERFGKLWTERIWFLFPSRPQFPAPCLAYRRRFMPDFATVVKKGSTWALTLNFLHPFLQGTWAWAVTESLWACFVFRKMKKITPLRLL